MLGIVGALYGPVVMILLVTSIDVYSKYLLHSDLEVLDKQGRIDLIQPGLLPDEKQEDQNIGQMVLTAVKNISARLRKEEATPISKPDSINMSCKVIRGLADPGLETPSTWASSQKSCKPVSIKLCKLVHLTNNPMRRRKPCP